MLIVTVQCTIMNAFFALMVGLCDMRATAVTCNLIDKKNLNIILSIYYYFLLIFQVGDGTNFVLVFAGALLDAAEGLLRTVKLA